jgi:hypothetical protein
MRLTGDAVSIKVNGSGEERSGLGKQLVARRLVVNTGRSKKYVGRKVLVDLWMLGGRRF